jgi:hypothetical protein
MNEGGTVVRNVLHCLPKEVEGEEEGNEISVKRIIGLEDGDRENQLLFNMKMTDPRRNKARRV